MKKKRRGASDTTYGWASSNLEMRVVSGLNLHEEAMGCLENLPTLDSQL